MSGNQENQKKRLREDEEAATTTSAVMTAGAGASNNMNGILDLNDDIFRGNICSFLDRQSMIGLMKENKTLSKCFRLNQYFCRKHGTRLHHHKSSENDVKMDCIDCLMSWQGLVCCEECNDFAYHDDFTSCAGYECNREACEDCFPPVYCSSCYRGPYCEDCLDGFQCPHCNQYLCKKCVSLVVSCENYAMCEKAACFECSVDVDIIKCDADYCTDCNEMSTCGACQETFCSDCHEGLSCSGCDKHFCTACEDGKETTNSEDNSNVNLCTKCVNDKA